MANVLVCRGAGIAARDASHLYDVLGKIGREAWDVQYVDEATLASAPWIASTRLLVVPTVDSEVWASAWRTPSPQGSSPLARIQHYVQEGGILWICGADTALREEVCAGSSSSRRTLGQTADGVDILAWQVKNGHVMVAPSAIEVQRVRTWLAALPMQLPSMPEGVPTVTPMLVASTSAPLLEAWRTSLQASAHPSTTDTPLVVHDTKYTLAVYTPSSLDHVQTWLSSLPPKDNHTDFLVVPVRLLEHASQYAPAFVFPTYYDALQRARGLSSALPWPSPRSFTTRIGDVVAYGRVVDSTQTLLESNHALLQACREGTTFIATQQVQGRGRGGNVWISPQGCLQFSTVVRLPMHIGSKAVFLQYLAALAIVYGLSEAYPAVRGRVRIKWPNDVYAQVDTPQRGSMDVQEDGQVKHFVKMGGILVTAVCLGDTFHAIVGCGVNCLNDQPTTSVHALAGTDTVTQEACAGAIVGALESALRTFIDASYSFAPFADAYRAAWLHSDQVIRLASHGTEPMRIVGITSHTGLLRTVPTSSWIRSRDEAAWHGAHVAGAVDVQPDGNSFDMLAGLVQPKSHP